MLATAVALVGLLAQVPSAPAGVSLVSGTVVDDDSLAPLPGADVRLTRFPDASGSLPLHSVLIHADGNGRFEFARVAPGKYSLSAHLAGYAQPTVAAPPLTMLVTATERVPVMELRLQRSAMLSGRVLTAEGRPAAGVAVYVRRKERGRPGAPTRMSPVSSGHTEVDGAFRVDDLAPGDYYLQAIAQEAPPPGPALTLAGGAVHLPTYFPGTTDRDAALPVSALKGATTDIGVWQMLSAPSFQVAGTVVDGNGRAVSGVMVRLVPADAPSGALPMTVRERAFTDASGAFAITGVLNGHYRVVAVPALETGRVAPGREDTESSMYRRGGAHPDSLGGSVYTQTSQGITRQYRDELAAEMPVDVDNASQTGLVLTVRRPVPR
jgi:5-hydroxyisourate hydrolase-like protein (transthyretin family)